MAGVMNVRAERSIQWPEKQEIGELQLNFIKLAPKANPIKRAIISATPLILGLVIISLIAINVFRFEAVMEMASSGKLEDVASALSFMVSAPDFWLWFYIAFTVANTMFPTIPKDTQAWSKIIGGIIALVLTLLILGIGQSLIDEVTLSLAQFLNNLSAILLLMIGINLIMVMILGLIEYTIERITGHSATFQKGKMITMTREEVQQLKQQEQEKRQARRTAAQRRLATVEQTSIYMFELPIPGPPGQEPITKGVAAVLGMDNSGELPKTVEDNTDEVIETTATDSARQRMLKLFPEKEEQKDISVEQRKPSQPTLPDGKEEKKPAKPKFDIQSYPEPISSKTENDVELVNAEDDEPEETVPTKDTFKTEESIQVEKVEKPEPPQKTASTIEPQEVEIITPEQSEDGSQSDLISEEDDDSSAVIDLSKLRQPGKNLTKSTTEGDQKKTSTDVKDTPTESSTTSDDTTIEVTKPISKPEITSQKPTSRFDEDDIDEDDFDDVQDDEDEQLDTSKDRRFTAQFSRPFVPRETLPDEEDDFNDVEDDEDEQSIFARPFANPISNQPSKSSDWRSQLTSPTDDTDDEDDEQLSRPSSRTSSIFDSINTLSDTKKSSPSSDWRSQLTSPTNDENDDEDDEQLSRPSSRTSSIFDSINTPSDTKKPSTSSDWRSQLTSPTNDNDDDEDNDEETLSRRSVLGGLGRSRINKPSTTNRQKDIEDEDFNELSYEPLEDDLIYEDDDELDYYDDDEELFDDD